tara:strand:+ start:195 stop:875 length:681 start_codon:yes stop_codon:yes gene_type:complete
MSDIVLSVDVRENTGTGPARAARRDGFVPGVLYGGKQGSVAIAVSEKDLNKAISTGKFLSHMVTLKHKGDKQSVIPKDVQFDPVSDKPLHVDLFRVDDDTMIDVEVTVHFTNEEAAPGLKRGGVLNIVRHAVELSCPASKIPDAIVIDLTGYEIGDSVHISSITLPDGVTPTITDRDFTIATVQGARVMLDEEEGDEDEDGVTEVTEGGEDIDMSEDGDGDDKSED